MRKQLAAQLRLSCPLRLPVPRRYGSALRRTLPYLRPCRRESGPAFRKSGPELRTFRTGLATAQEKNRRCSRDLGTIAQRKLCPNRYIQRKVRIGAPENRTTICDLLRRSGALFHEADSGALMQRR